VGTKLDIRDRSTTCIKAGIGDKASTFVSHSQGQTLANKLNAVKYIECSSQIIEGIREVFVEAAKAGLCMTENQKGSRSLCNIA
jgi:Ras family protein A